MQTGQIIATSAKVTPKKVFSFKGIFSSLLFKLFFWRLSHVLLRSLNHMSQLNRCCWWTELYPQKHHWDNLPETNSILAPENDAWNT